MTTPCDRRQAGFSLLEMLIGISLFLATLAMIGVALESNRRSYVRGEKKMDVQQSARLALSEMTRQIRMAGYFPENFGPAPADPALIHPVQIATDGGLAIYGDPDGSGTSEVILFCLDGTLLRRGKAPAGDPAAYWCPAGDVLAENVTSLRFNYFDEDHVSVPSSPTAPYNLDGQSLGSVPSFTSIAQRSAVRRVEIAITAMEEVSGHGPQVYSLGSEVLLRNVR